MSTTSFTTTLRAMPRGLRALRGLSLAAAAVCLATSASAIDLLEAYRLAAKSEPMLQAARISSEADRENLAQARGQMLPYVYVSASRYENRLTQIAPSFLGTEQTLQSHYPSESRAVVLRQPLYRPGLTAQYRQVQAQILDSEAQAQAEVQNLASRVALTYFDTMLSYEQLGLIQMQRKFIDAQVDAAQKLFAAGSGTRTDIDETRARLDLNQAQELEARQTVQYNLQQIEALVGVPVTELSPMNVAQLKLETPPENQLQEWLDRAERNNPQLQSLLARVRSAEEEIAKANANHRPTVDAVIQWSDSQSETASSLSNRYIQHNAGVQLNLPIYAGGSVSAQVRQAVLRKDKAEQLLEAGRRDIGMRVRKEFRSLGETAARTRALETALASADQLVTSSRKSYQAGSRTVIDVLNAEQQRTLVQRDLTQSRYLHLAAKVRLQALVGEANEESVAALNSVFSSQP